ncbi:MAG: efflux RND transporter periplasmic adaptor subunit [Bacteroidetes bacterium]|nr:efflux RND transporter periplasmic adaptor subunit [Bacteroidota bacterium]
MNTNKHSKLTAMLILILASLFMELALQGCNTASSAPVAEMPAQSLPVISVNAYPVTTYKEFTASLEGNRDIEIRPQVDGYLDKIFVDEGASVHKGQMLFHIDARSYQEQLNNAIANLQSAKAALENASINVEKLSPLVQNNVISDVQLKSAKATYDAAKANVAQAQAAVEAAKINLGFTNITAPADGFIGKIPLKTGSLVGRTTADALTVLSETKEMHVYFSMSENDFLQFKKQIAGNSIDEKIKHLPQVELVLPDKSVYNQKGKVEIVQGQFDKAIGTINFRATFPNEQGLLRSGNTGKIRLPQQASTSIVVPQESTFETQDKIFVFTVNDSSKVAGRLINVSGRAGNYYVVSNGLNAGDKVVYAGLGRLQDGVKINPQIISMDSLIKVSPLSEP